MYFFMPNVYMSSSFSEYPDLHLIKLLKFPQGGIYLLPLELLQESGMMMMCYNPFRPSS